MGKITDLPPGAAEKMPEFAERWIEWGLRTGLPTDEEDARWLDGVKRVYAFCGNP